MAREKAFLDEKIIAAKAVELIDDEGFERFSTRRLALALGTSVMTLYNYYPSKDAILRDAVLRAFDLLLKEMPGHIEPYLAGECGSPLRVFKFLGSYLEDFAVRKPNLYSFLFRSDLMPLQRDERVATCYEYIFRRISRFVTVPEKKDELHDHIYLFEILENSLVQNAHRGRGDLTPEMLNRLLGEAYDSLLRPYESCVPGKKKD